VGVESAARLQRHIIVRRPKVPQRQRYETPFNMPRGPYRSWQTSVMSNGPVAYVEARVSPTAQDLATWKVDWRAMTASGACPRCGDDTATSWTATAVPMSPQDRDPQPDDVTRDVVCACNGTHTTADGEPKNGCGAFWGTTFYEEHGVAHAAPVPADSEVAAAAAALREAQRDAETRLRAAADKWVGGVSAVLALFGIASTVAGGKILDNLSDSRKGVVLALTLAAVVMAVFAIFAAYVAAYGWPKEEDVSNDRKLVAWYNKRQARLAKIACRVRCGVVAAVVSFGLVTIAAGIAFLAPPKTPDPTLKVTLSDGSIRCGLLQTGKQSGQLNLRLSDGSVAAVPVVDLVRVEPARSC
jgi:hypothetical protein